MAKVRFNKKLTKAAAIDASKLTENVGKIYFGTDEGIVLDGAVKAEVNKIDTLAVNGVNATVANKAASVTIDGADIALDGYAKATLVRAINATDTVNEAIGILEKKIENVGTDALEEVEAGNGIEVSEKSDHKQTVSAKAKAGDKYIEVTADGIASTGIDEAIEAAVEELDVIDTAVAGKLVKAVSEEDGKISVSRDFLATTDIKIEKLGTAGEGLAAEYKLVNGNNVALGVNIQIPKDQFLKSAHFYAKADDVPAEEEDYPDGFEFPGIRFEFETSAGTSVSWISVKDLVDVYTAGNGIDITNNVVSAKVHAEDYIKVDANGLYTDGIDGAIATAVAAEAAIARAAEQANAAAIEAEEARATEAEEALDERLDVIEGEDEGSIKKAVADEAALRTAADTALGNRIAAFEADGDHDVAVLEGRVTTAEGEIDALQAASHTHANKTLLDTYTQTEANLADAVAKKHEHTNKTVLDGITAEKVTSWDNEVGAKAAIDAMDASISGSDAGLSYSLTQVDGKVTAMSVELLWEE